MKSIAFFVVVFSAMLITLYLSVDMGPDEGQQPAPPEPPAQESPATADAVNNDNTIEIPIYDTQKGRLAYVLRGELPPDVIKFPGVDEAKHYILNNGELEIPIYSDMAGSIPRGVSPISRIAFRFHAAEYREVHSGRIGGEESVHLSGGGEGRADDGSLLSFENLHVLIQDGDERIYTIRSSTPISIRNGLLEMTSPSGMEGVIGGGSDLKTITFLPPVTTYIDAKSAALFALKTPDGGGEDDTRKIVITCAGPLLLDRTSDPPRIEFQDDVKIFPVEGVVDGQAPAPGAMSPGHASGATWFHAQKLALLIRNRADGPPEFSEAIATWENGRVKASYEGYLVDGESLRWKNLGEASATDGLRSEAILDGRPSFKGEWVEFQADEARLRLNERRVLLTGFVEGILQQVRDDPEDEPQDGVEGQEKLPRRWAFNADDVDLRLSEPAAKKGLKTTSRGSRARKRQRERGWSDLDRLESFIATARTNDGLVLKSLGEDGLEMRGRELRYDGQEQRITLLGGPAKTPRFSRGKSRGTAETIVFFLKDKILRLRGDVDVKLDQEEIENLQASRAPDPGTRRQPAAAGADESPLHQGLAIRGDQIDIKLDDARKVHSVTARSLGDRPITLQPLGEAGNYRIEGSNLFWDHKRKIALMEDETVSTSGTGPRLEFRGGVVTARKIRFDKSRWVAALEGDVVIRSLTPPGKQTARRSSRHGQDDDKPARASSAGENLTIRATRARVAFFPWLKPRASAVQDDCFPELRSVHKVHAWAGPEEKITITASTYSARTGEATWDSVTQELRLFGDGTQEFRRIADGLPDILQAEEIVYERDDGTIRLERNVTGQFLMANLPDGAAADAGSTTPRGPGGPVSARPRAVLVWTYATDSLRLKVRTTRDCEGLELVALTAYDKFFLECKSEGIKLHGDDLEYDHGQQQIRIYSRDGRYQTLSREDRTDENKTRINKIDSREILVQYRRAAALRGVEEPEYIVVRFFDDVTAAFFPPSSMKLPIGPSSADNTEWKLRSNYLGMRILPGVDVAKAVASAYAEGEVIFTSADMKAMAQEAIYEEEKKHLILRGSDKTKVQISSGNRSISDDTVILSRQGPRFRIKWRGESYAENPTSRVPDSRSRPGKDTGSKPRQ